jgi:1,4-dihydroxy-2-naphthoate octaprenyltransferase
VSAREDTRAVSAREDTRAVSAQEDTRALGGRGRLAAWVQASRLPSQLYLALPLLLGQAAAVHVHGRGLSLPVLLAVQLFGVLDQLYIVYSNDLADEETDRRNATATPFSGGSRVLVEGRLTRAALRRAALGCAGGLLVLSGALAWARGAPLLVPLALLALLLLWAYSHPPLRLSYRGGGELLQMAGVAGVLPLYGFLAQGGALTDFPWALLLPLLPTHLACAIATALPDAPSDAASGKRTWAVRAGGEGATWTLAALNALSLALLPPALRALGLAVGPALAWAWLPALATLLAVAVRPAPPGSRALQLRVGAAITATLSLVAGLLHALLGGTAGP